MKSITKLIQEWQVYFTTLPTVQETKPIKVPYLQANKASIIGFYRQGATIDQMMENSGASANYIYKIINEYLDQVI